MPVCELTNFDLHYPLPHVHETNDETFELDKFISHARNAKIVRSEDAMHSIECLRMGMSQCSTAYRLCVSSVFPFFPFSNQFG